MAVRIPIWIEVDEKLPPAGIDVLIACADGVQQGVLRKGGFRSYLRGNETAHDVTHWMGLPQHPLNDLEDGAGRSGNSNIRSGFIRQ